MKPYTPPARFSVLNTLQILDRHIPSNLYVQFLCTQVDINSAYAVVLATQVAKITTQPYFRGLYSLGYHNEELGLLKKRTEKTRI